MKDFELIKDFYTLKTQYEVSMANLQRVIDKHERDLTKLTNSFNQLRDSFAEHIEKSNGKGK